MFEAAARAGLAGEGIARGKAGVRSNKQGSGRVRQTGTVEVPQEAFLAVLKVER